MEQESGFDTGCDLRRDISPGFGSDRIGGPVSEDERNSSENHPHRRIIGSTKISDFTPVRVVDSNGEQIGVVETDEARRFASERGLDLVEIAPDARPPVCKIMDYGKFIFERDKKAKEAKRRQHRIETKEVKFRPTIGDHDFATKVRRAEEFLSSGYHVKLTIMFRMRELRRPENGYDLLHRATEELADVSTVENPPPKRLQGRDLTMVLKPAN